MRSRAQDVDAEGAAEPLPGLGYDVLLDPRAGGFAHRLDLDDRAVIGNLEIIHCRVFHQAECHDSSTPARTQHVVVRPRSTRLIEREGAVSAARRPRSTSDRPSVSGIDQAWAARLGW
jgi:hypothetical protein